MQRALQRPYANKIQRRFQRRLEGGRRAYHKDITRQALTFEGALLLGLSLSLSYYEAGADIRGSAPPRPLVSGLIEAFQGALLLGLSCTA